MKVIGIIGRSGSGKTTVIEQLIRTFVEMGYTCGTLKDLKRADYTMDTVGKNTYRHKAAGASPVTARGDNSTEIMFTERLEADELLSYYNTDIVLLEGFRDLQVPQLLTGRDEAELNEKYTDGVLAITGIYAASHDSWNDLPCYNVLTDVQGLCRFILDTVPEHKAAGKALYIKGRKLPLSPLAAAELSRLLGDEDADLEYK